MSTAPAPASADRHVDNQTGRVGFWKAASIVAGREISVKLRSKAFVIATVIMLAFVIAAIILAPRLGGLFDQGGTVATTGDLSSVVSEVTDDEIMEVADAQAARDAVAAGDADSAVVASEDGDGFLVIAEREMPQSLVEALSVAPEVELLDPNAPNPFLAMFIALGFGVVWFSSALTFGNQTANSVVEEKQTRIVEMLLASVSAKALLTGKVMGSSIIAIAQVTLIGIAAVIGGVASGNQIVLDGLAEPILWFIPLFAVGFVMISALYAAGASLVSRTEDIPSTTQPITWLIMLPYMAIVLFFSNQTALQVMSYIPFSAPVAVPVRLFYGTTEWWEPVLSLAIMIVTTGLLILFSAKVYERALLRTGKALKWKEALSSKS